MIAIPHAECAACRELVPLLKYVDVFCPDDPPILRLAPHQALRRHTRSGRVVTLHAQAHCEGSLEEAHP